jgi:hypothetical protein
MHVFVVTRILVKYASIYYYKKKIHWFPIRPTEKKILPIQTQIFLVMVS